RILSAVDEQVDLTTLDGLAAALAEQVPGHAAGTELLVANGTFCPRCRDVRRMVLRSMVWLDRWADGRYTVMTGANVDAVDNPMLGPKIGALEVDENPPRWFSDLGPEYLNVMNKLGNAAVHPNDDGDVEPQQVFDAEFVREVEAFFTGLLDEVYEAPTRREKN